MLPRCVEILMINYKKIFLRNLFDKISVQDPKATSEHVKMG